MAAERTITSAANPLVKRMRLLAQRRHRRAQGAFVVEGVQPVWRAVEAGAPIEVLVVAPDLLGDSPALRMVAECAASGVQVARLSAELFGRLSERDGPSGLAAIVRGRLLPLDGLKVGPASVVVALHQVANPGNLGTVLRTADATGAAGVVLVGDSSDPFSPTAVRASMGSLFAVQVRHTPTLTAFFDWADAHGVHVVATSGSAADDHWSGRYPTPLALLFGSEGSGLPPEALARSDRVVRIPMVGTAESLNLAVAAGVMLYEVRRGTLGSGG